jgi:glutamine synthetase/predicted TIM-barrel fold metal-dependent hydrolase
MNQPADSLKPTIEQLRHVANRFPIIDSHAHNLILPTLADTIPFESITTEAQGRALRDAFKSLPHLRAARQLRQLYECGEDADWEDVLEQRVEWLRSDPQRLHQRCFEGVHAVMVDDGLAEPKKVYPYDSHDEYLQASSKRIVRIETIAERLMERIVRDANENDLGKPKFLPDIWVEFTDEFEREIQEAVQDPEVAGFKTIICYRTGLDIEPDYEEAARAVGHPFERYVKSCIRRRTYRIERKPLNDYLVLRTLEILSEEVPHSDSLAKPLQFHTGLGDNDISLLESNPAHLQQVIEAYPSVPFVLLHSAYPFTQEAGYLATVYRHVYLDLGEVFPMVSRDGQEAVLRQALELIPGSKLLYSSGGRWFPESFYLANLQFREVWLEVSRILAYNGDGSFANVLQLLTEYVQKGDITTYQAIAMTKDILFNNSNTLYNLHYQATFDETPLEVPKQLTFNTKSARASPHPSPGFPPIPPAGSTTQPATSGPIDPRSGSPYEPPTFPPPPKAPQIYDNQVFDEFMKRNTDVRYVYVQWLDYMAIVHARVVPIKEFTRMIQDGGRIRISPERNKASSPSDTGLYVEPDLRSLRRTHDKDPLPSATVFSYWRSESGAPHPSCPRTSLETLINTLQYTHATTLFIGFEIGVTFLSRNAAIVTTKDRQHVAFLPLTATHARGNLTLPFVSDILLALDKGGIDIQQFHAAETGQGQYVLTLSPQPPLLAIDTLVQARQTITQIAALHNLHATFHPSPFINTAHRDDDEEEETSHLQARISVHPPTHDTQFFVAGVLAHLPAICAFSMPITTSSSYAFAKQNDRQAHPLRQLKDGTWELDCLNGVANMYLAIAAIIGAGLLGLQSAGVEQEDVGRRVEMPMDFGDAIRALNADGALREVLDHEVVNGYVRATEDEWRLLSDMGELERREWGIERY